MAEKLERDAPCQALLACLDELEGAGPHRCRHARPAQALRRRRR